ncbi:MAG: undecaprenyl-diphosphate phosphatase [Ruminococcaceae bacterium]|nr:undecaprenyl-diphosphate phosphatase [Oscillospiraceae bacterium]
MTAVIELLKAILYGILEGITEWLPVSSTGHLILLGEWLPFGFTENALLLEEFNEMFEVVIQLGAILAVVVLFWRKLWPFQRNQSAYVRRESLSLWLKVVISCIPAGLVGVVGDKLLEELSGKDIDGWLFNGYVVAVALIVYGVAFLFLERFNRAREVRVETVADITCLQALWIGLFQILAIVPGTSRSGSTILGSMLLGLSRTAAAEFSFFMAIPVMVGAGGIKVLGFLGFLAESAVTMPLIGWGILGVSFVVSFVVSMMAIRFLTDFVKRHSFAPFGVYRIALGLLVLFYFIVVK